MKKREISGSKNDPKQVKLLCRKCGNHTMTARERYEPAAVATVTCICCECDPYGFDSLEYLDANGRDLGDIFENQ